MTNVLMWKDCQIRFDIFIFHVDIWKDKTWLGLVNIHLSLFTVSYTSCSKYGNLSKLRQLLFPLLQKSVKIYVA